MYAVFYDLETTSKNQIGQILNYSFICVDDDFKIVGELSGLIKISRLQLPEPGAILANRTDVLEHQRLAKDNEREAMKKIEAFLGSCIQQARGAISFIGYNSSKFDLLYLRTSFIRNGINPYFGGKLSTRDLLHAVQKAYLSSEKFRELVRKQCAGSEKQRLSLSLQTVSHALDLLHGVQAHESREDVLLTIKVAEWLKRECAIDVRTYEPYEGARLHSTARTGSVYEIEEPQYDLTEPLYYKRTPMCLLDENGKGSLWINLERYAEEPSAKSIVWRQAMKHSFFTTGAAYQGRDIQEVARKALGQFQKVTLRNYFERSSCDIEMDIYRIDFDALGVYGRAIESGKREVLAECQNPEAKVLWVRYRLANAEDGAADPRVADLLRQYAAHRYGGKLQLVKTIRNPTDTENYHPKLQDFMSELLRSREVAVAFDKKDDVKLLDSLEAFYRSSEIVKVAGDLLVPGLARFANGS
jgi:hypothetical protein